jgi:hypothetical protein
MADYCESDLKEAIKEFNGYLTKNPEFPWCLCQSSATLACNLMKKRGINCRTVHYKEDRLSEAPHQDCNPNHVWVETKDHYYDAKADKLYEKKAQHPFGGSDLIEEYTNPGILD